MCDSSTKIDYLTEDLVINDQKYVCLSFLSPEGISNCKIRGLKVRGSFETYDEAKAHAEELRNIDKYHNVFVGEVGKWLPWDPEPDSKQVKESNYAEEELHQLMKSYRENQIEAKNFEQQRKNNMIHENIEHNIKTRKENRNEVLDDLNKLTESQDNKNELLEKNLKATLTNIDEEIEKLEQKATDMIESKNKTLNNLEEIEINDDEISNTENELEKTKKLLSKLTEKNI